MMDINGSGISSLPHDLLVDVLTKVASSSFTDLLNTKLCCKEFRRAAEEEDILEEVSIEKFPVIHQWRKSNQLNGFMNRCMARGNPEALFRQGMVEYFTHGRMQLALENLRRASEKRHVEATYVYAIILLCVGGESTVKGSSLLNSLEKKMSSSSKSGGSNTFQECRENIQTVLKSMWIKNRLVDRRISSCRHRKINGVRVVGTWEGRREEEQEGGVSCKSCKWDREVRLFRNLL